MKAQLLLGNVIFCFPILALAQIQCVDIKDGALRLACYDYTYGVAQNPESTTPVTPPKPKENGEPQWMENFQVRDQGLQKMASIAGPAIVGVSRENCKDTSVVKASVIYSGAPFSTSGSGWYPFSSLSIDRNLAASTPRNVWGIQFGTRGTILDYTQTGFAFDTKLSLGRKEDTQAKTASNQVLLDTQIVIKGVATGEPWPNLGTTFQLVPTVAVVFKIVVA